MVKNTVSDILEEKFHSILDLGTTVNQHPQSAWLGTVKAITYNIYKAEIGEGWPMALSFYSFSS